MMKHFSKANIQSWERFYRSNFINCLSGFKSATLIGTTNNVKQTNLSIFSNVVHLGAEPPMIGFINRPKEAAPHTIKNIEATGVYTMNHIHKNFIKQAHQTSAKYAEGESEFEKVGLTIEWKDNCRRHRPRHDDCLVLRIPPPHVSENSRFDQSGTSTGRRPSLKRLRTQSQCQSRAGS